jgi:hypothetical protein
VKRLRFDRSECTLLHRVLSVFRSEESLASTSVSRFSIGFLGGCCQSSLCGEALHPHLFWPVGWPKLTEGVDGIPK